MLISQVRNLYYKKGFSTNEIATKFNLTVWQVISFMRKNNLPRRKQSETRSIQFNKQPLSYLIKRRLTNTERGLKIAGLMLYWAEGSNRGKHTVDFSNSKPSMTKLYLKFLRRIYQIEETKLRVFLYCYSNQNTNNLIRFWSKYLKISPSQFSKPYVRNSLNSAYPNRMKYGLAHIRYSDKRLLVQIKAEIDILQRKLNKLRWRSGQSHLSVEEAVGRPT